MEKKIQFYVDMIIAARLAANPDYNPEKDSGLIGDALELAIKDFYGRPLVISKQGHSDIRIGSRNYEIKNGGGELGNEDGKLVKGSGWAIYVPVVLVDYPLSRQDGYVMTRQDFIDSLDEAGAIRRKTSTSGQKKVTIQTFWNRKLNKPHGKLMFRMIEAFESRDNEELCEFLMRTKREG